MALPINGNFKDASLKHILLTLSYIIYIACHMYFLLKMFVYRIELSQIAVLFSKKDFLRKNICCNMALPILSKNRPIFVTSVWEMCSSGPDEDLFHFMLDCPEYTPIRNNYLNLITEQFPGLSFVELSPFDKMQFSIGDVSFSLDT
jgi:hypothetical protein